MFHRCLNTLFRIRKEDARGRDPADRPAYDVPPAYRSAPKAQSVAPAASPSAMAASEVRPESSTGEAVMSAATASASAAPAIRNEANSGGLGGPNRVPGVPP